MELGFRKNFANHKKTHRNGGSVTVFCFLFRSSDRYMHIPLISNIDLNKIDNYTAYSDGIL